MKCNEIEQFINSYMELDENDPLRIEIEAHLFDCEHCSSLLELDYSTISFSEYPFDDTDIKGTNIDYINKHVMDRIYAEEAWYLPIATKSYQFSRNFRRNIAMIIASCLAMFSIALFVFIFDYKEDTKSTIAANVSGVVDIANANSINLVSSNIYKGQIPVASISDPIVMQVVPTFPQYYVALSLLGIIMTILLLNWFTRTRS
ncbi:MAG: zf-HC2 domain-containing protein [Candidatus Pristimantibacillus lignocellulolyticus]|uniref:Zf-HC2 domain-containing protein n=1 Tax=Candidatus Pristimantibacillus lignocellulolyticus TaxID=2994561 RepID=A0A9J6ZDL3_9BACL|nr:MAG: zf-HC2 domain-containing protein [Candidatus Pristimantibacillus lignocellulolyticus]